MDTKSKIGRIDWIGSTDGTNYDENGRDRDSRTQGHLQFPRFQWQGCQGIDREFQMKNLVPVTNNAREARDTLSNESVDRARPRLKIQSSLKFPSEDEELDVTILLLRLFKQVGYTDFKIAFGYCNQSRELMAMLVNIQPFQQTNLEEFFNVLRERRPVDLNKVIKEFFNKRQGQNETEGALMAYLRRKYNLMHGEVPGQFDGPILRDGEKLLIRHQFITALKDDYVRIELSTSTVSFEDLASEARRLRHAKEFGDMVVQERKKEEHEHSSMMSVKIRKNTEDNGSRTCKAEKKLHKKNHKNFKTAAEIRVAKFKVFNLGKLENPLRIPSIFNPEPDFIYEQGKSEGFVMFQDGYRAHSIIQNIKNPLVRRAVGKIQFWPLEGYYALKVAELFNVKSIN